MLRKPIVTLLAIITLSLLDATAARGATISITNSDSGWYNEVGDHQADVTNYFSGQNPGFDDLHYRNWFVFDLTAAAGETITGAQLQLYTYQITESGTYTTYDVATPVPTLTAGGTGLVGIYADLGSGASFGSLALTTADEESLILINLNAAAVADIQANADISALFAIGGDFLSDSGFGHAYGFSSFDPRNQLILQTAAATVPDGGLTISFLGGTLMAFGMLRRKFNS